MNIDWTAFTPWSALAGGAIIGGAAAIFALVNGRIAGISGILGGLLRPTLAYAAAPVKEQIAQDCAEAQAAAESEASACPIDPEALAAGHIAIVIPRGT